MKSGMGIPAIGAFRARGNLKFTTNIAREFATIREREQNRYLLGGSIFRRFGGAAAEEPSSDP
jgi:hypothetical protein